MYHKHLKNFIPLNHSSANILRKPMTEKSRVGWFLDFVVITFVITSASSFFERTSGSGWFFEKIQKTGRVCERTSYDPTIQGRFFDQFSGLWKNHGTLSKSVLWGYKNHWSRVYEWWLVLSKKKSAQHWKNPIAQHREHKLYSIQPVAGGRLDTNLNKWGWPGDARNIMWERISCSAQSSQTWTHPKALINPSQSYIQGSGLVRGISLQHSRLSSKLFGWTEAFPSEHFLKLKAYQLKDSILPKRKSWVLQFNARV